MNDVAAVPPKLTAVAPVNPEPVITTLVVAPDVVGVNDVMLGDGLPIMNNDPARFIVPLNPRKITRLYGVLLLGFEFTGSSSKVVEATDWATHAPAT